MRARLPPLTGRPLLRRHACKRCGARVLMQFLLWVTFAHPILGSATLIHAGPRQPLIAQHLSTGNAPTSTSHACSELTRLDISDRYDDDTRDPFKTRLS